MEIFLLKSSLVKKISFWFFDYYALKLLGSQQPMGTKVEEEDPSVLLPRIGAEKMTRSLLRGCQFDLF